MTANRIRAEESKELASDATNARRPRRRIAIAISGSRVSFRCRPPACRRVILGARFEWLTKTQIPETGLAVRALVFLERPARGHLSASSSQLHLVVRLLRPSRSWL